MKEGGNNMSSIKSPETANPKKSDVILRSFLKTIKNSTKADVVEFFRYDSEGNQLILEACEVSCKHFRKTERIKIGGKNLRRNEWGSLKQCLLTSPSFFLCWDFLGLNFSPLFFC